MKKSIQPPSNQAKKTGKRLETIDKTAKAIDASVIITKCIIIPVGTWRYSNNVWLRIAAIFFGVASALYEARRKKK